VTPEDWYRDNGCDHAHCPYLCEHPQPFVADGVLVCGRCAVKYGELNPMIPCTPETCGEGNA
jgi:hypothetical protein